MARCDRAAQPANIRSPAERGRDIAARCPHHLLSLPAFLSLDIEASFGTFRLMDADEKEIFQYLKTWGGNFINAMEICRRADKRRFHEDPNWAKQPLVRMAERGILESDISGRYRIKRVKKEKHKEWVSPEVAQKIEEGGVPPAPVEEEGEIGDDEYYDNL
jgi:hypothetical protein